jgi:hypothetical protein
MDNSRTVAAHRLEVLAQQQLAACEADAAQQQLFLNPTAAASGGDANARMEAVMEQGEPYAVPLPEKLYPDQPWRVFRCVRCQSQWILHLLSVPVSTSSRQPIAAHVSTR